jgi:hypothetical protein
MATDKYDYQKAIDNKFQNGRWTGLILTEREDPSTNLSESSKDRGAEDETGTPRTIDCTIRARRSAIKSAE